jgi:hypothetical protein
MINFRFHIISLVAIFLALALGVVVGAGVIDRGVVDTLNDRLDRVEAKSDQQQLLNDVLTAANNRDRDAIDVLQPYVVANRLTGEQVAVVAVRGVDEGRVDATVVAAQQAGGDVTGVLWIEERWGQPGEDARALAVAVGNPALRSSRLRVAAWEALAGRLASPPLVVSDTDPDLLTTLEAGEFVSYAEVEGGLAMGAFPGRNAIFLLVIGEDADVASDTVIMPATAAFSEEDLLLTIGDVYADLELGPARGDVFDDLRESELSRTTSTVDDLDLAQGPMTAVLALADLTCVPPVVGHYGYGPNTRPMPDFTTACRGLTSPASVR